MKPRSLKNARLEFSCPSCVALAAFGTAARVSYDGPNQKTLKQTKNTLKTQSKQRQTGGTDCVVLRPESWAPKRRRSRCAGCPTFRACFSLLPPIFSLSPSLGVFSLIFGGVFGGRGPLKCTLGLSGPLCETRVSWCPVLRRLVWWPFVLSSFSLCFHPM